MDSGLDSWIPALIPGFLVGFVDSGLDSWIPALIPGFLVGFVDSWSSYFDEARHDVDVVSSKARLYIRR